jgi:electron transport complex protein RnfD
MNSSTQIIERPYYKNLSVSFSPHVRASVSTERIMWTVVACLMPSLILSMFVFGLQTLVITAVSVISCVLTEAISQKLLKQPITIMDGSAVITGVLMAYVIPPGVPVWMPIPGAIMAIFITKIIMGGLGFNVFNPALMGRALLMASYPVAMTAGWVTPIRDLSLGRYFNAGVDAVSSATPLYVLKHYGISGLIEKYGSLSNMYFDFFFGFSPGCIGETSACVLLVGGLILLYKGYITWHIPASVIGSTAFLTWIFGGETWFSGNPILAVLSGGVILGAFFMATDYVTSPNEKRGQMIFGAGIGALTVLIRLKGGYPEGVCYAILLMNPLVPALDQWFRPKRFSEGAL